MSYDIAAGMDTATLNSIIGQVYNALYPNLLKDTVSVGDFGISSVGFDIVKSPTVNLIPSVTAKKHITEIIEKNTLGKTSALSPKIKSHLIELAAAASFDCTMPSIVLAINYANGAPATHVTVALSAAVSIKTAVVDQKNVLTVQLLAAKISVPSDPTIEALVNNAFVPYFMPYLNTKILSPIIIPALEFGPITVSMPAPAVQMSDIVVYSNLGSAQPDIPAPSSWSDGCLFVGVDAAVLQAAAAIPFPLGPGTGFDWDIISGRVEAQIQAPSPIIINKDGGISATIVADALAQLTLHTPWPLPNVNFGPRARASLTATLKPAVINSQLCLTIQGIPIPDFSFDWGIPDWINWLFSPLEKGLALALNAVLGPLISQVLSLPPIPIYTIPSIPIDFGPKTINISITQASTANKDSLLIVNAQAKIS